MAAVDNLTIALLVLLIGNQVWIERKIAQISTELKFIKEQLKK